MGSADLTNFPITVSLDSSHGSSIFDELTDSTAYAKVQFTMGDGLTPLYAECEGFNPTSKIGIYHVSRMTWTISSSKDTDFYMYFDSTHADNTIYIGVADSTATQNVWNPEGGAGLSEHRSVIHMNSNPLNDSISNTFTSSSYQTPINTRLYKGIQFEGTYSPNISGWISGTRGNIYAMAFFKYVSNGAIQCLFQFGAQSSYTLALKITAAGRLQATYNATDGEGSATDSLVLTSGNWYHAVAGYYHNSGTVLLYRNGKYITSSSPGQRNITTTAGRIGSFYPYSGPTYQWPFQGIIDEIRVRQSTIIYTDDFPNWVKPEFNNLMGNMLGFDDLEKFEDYIDNLPYINDHTSNKYSHFGESPKFNDSSLNSTEFFKFSKYLKECSSAGSAFSKPIVSTYSLIYTTMSGGIGAYMGGVLSNSGDIHFVPCQASVGQKISPNGVVSTYSLIYTTNAAYAGGVLDMNGNIHFIPYFATVGQKISASGVVSTYSLIYTTAASYMGGVLSSSGEVYLVPCQAPVGQKISSTGIVSTYSLLYTTTTAYYGGVLAKNGYIYFIPHGAEVGQRISPSGVVSTYTLAYTTTNAYNGGVLSSNGDIYCIPGDAQVGQIISAYGNVSTYSLLYTTAGSYCGGVLSSNGDIHFIPLNASYGQRVSSSGVVSTYSLTYTTTTSYGGGILYPNGDIYMIPYYASVGQKLITLSAKNFGLGICCCPFYNKF